MPFVGGFDDLPLDNHRPFYSLGSFFLEECRSPAAEFFAVLIVCIHQHVPERQDRVVEALPPLYTVNHVLLEIMSADCGEELREGGLAAVVRVRDDQPARLPEEDVAELP